jgi:L-fuculose-phosphate aldolase
MPLREALVEAYRVLLREGLIVGRAGNVSARVDEGLVITPSAVTPDAMTPQDIAFVPFEGDHVGRPSSEWRFHRDLMAARADVQAIVHTHSPNATALATLRQPIPAAHYMVAIGGGHEIPLAPYATFGTAALSKAIVATLKGVDACLLANHGVVAAGASLEKAMDLAREVELLAQIHRMALSAGDPVILPPSEMDRVLKAFKNYGRGTVRKAPARKPRKRRSDDE